MKINPIKKQEVFESKSNLTIGMHKRSTSRMFYS